MAKLNKLFKALLGCLSLLTFSFSVCREVWPCTEISQPWRALWSVQRHCRLPSFMVDWGAQVWGHILISSTGSLAGGLQSKKRLWALLSGSLIRRRERERHKCCCLPAKTAGNSGDSHATGRSPGNSLTSTLNFLSRLPNRTVYGTILTHHLGI